MAALPSVNEVENHNLIPYHDRTALSLYRGVVLPAEKAASEADHNSGSDHAMFSRIVGYLLLYPPSEDARAVLKREIELCKHESDQNMAIYDLGDVYLKNFIQVFFRTGTREISTPDSEDLENYPKSPNCYALLMVRIPDRSETTPAAQSYSHAKAAALARDNFSCLLSSKPDVQSYWKRFITELPPGRRFAATECCYILPDLLGCTGTDGITTITKHQVETFWTILKRFGYEQVCHEIDGETPEANIRRMENIMTLDSMIHQGFDELFLWLEEVPGELNTYCVRLGGSMTYSDWDIPEEIVTFTPHTGDPLPSPAYLRIHAACCRVASMSGAAEYLNAIADARRETEALDEDGTSANVPTYARLDHG
ncbi:hypothetical protein V8D89_007726, partial [Ganoderma adspersum]